MNEPAVWLCVRCGTFIRSAGPPAECIKDQGGCERSRGPPGNPKAYESTEWTGFRGPFSAHDSPGARKAVEDLRRDTDAPAPRQGERDAKAILEAEPPSGVKLWLKEIEPRLKRGMDETAIAAELGVDVAYVRDMVRTWSTPLATLQGPELFADIRDAIAKHYYMERAWNYVVATLFVFQAWVTDVLPVVFYLLVGGPKGTGKTNFESLTAALTDALRFENVSVPAMARTMRHGRTVVMDEFDSDRGKEYNEVRDALIRSGYKSDAPAYVRWDPAKKAAEEVPVFGPRLIAYRGLLDDALQSRGFVIPSVMPNGEDAYEYVLRNLWPDLGDLSTRLKAWGADARAAFPPERLKELAWSEGFRGKVKSVVQEIGANRESELVTIALLVAKMAGVDVLQELKAASEMSQIEIFAASDSTLDELREVVVELSGFSREKLMEGAPDYRIRQPDIKKDLNRRRKERGERPVSDRAFAKLRRDLFVKDEWLRWHGHRLVWVLPEPFLRTLGTMGTMGTIDPYGVDGDHGDHGDQRGARGQDEIASALRDVLRELDESGVAADVGDILRVARTRDIPPAEVDRWLKRWLQEGEIFSPTKDHYRLTESLR